MHFQNFFIIHEHHQHTSLLPCFTSCNHICNRRTLPKNSAITCQHSHNVIIMTSDYHTCMSHKTHTIYYEDWGQVKLSITQLQWPVLSYGLEMTNHSLQVCHLPLLGFSETRNVTEQRDKDLNTQSNILNLRFAICYLTTWYNYIFSSKKKKIQEIWYIYLSQKEIQICTFPWTACGKWVYSS